jgi:hypothetical protein
MSRIAELRRQADLRRLAFLDTAEAVRQRATPLRILDDAVGAFEDEFKILQRIEKQLKANPFLFLAGFATLWLIARQINSGAPRKEPAVRRRGKSVRPSARKGQTRLQPPT